MVSFTSRPLYLRCLLNRRLGGPQRRSGRFGEDISAPAGNQKAVSVSASAYPSYYTDCAVPTPSAMSLLIVLGLRTYFRVKLVHIMLMSHTAELTCCRISIFDAFVTRNYQNAPLLASPCLSRYNNPVTAEPIFATFYSWIFFTKIL